MATADLDQLLEGRLVDKAYLQKVGGVHPQQQRRTFSDGCLVIIRVRAVGGANLDQGDARLAHDVRNAEPAADLDQLATRDDGLASLGQGRQNQQHGRGVVVGDDRVFGAGQTPQQIGDQVVARAALAPVQVVLEIRVALGCVAGRVQGRLTERRAAQIGVDDYTRRVQDGPQARLSGFAHTLLDQPRQIIQSERPAAVPRGATGLVEDVARGLQRQIARQVLEAWVAEQPIDGRQIARRHLAHGQRF